MKCVLLGGAGFIGSHLAEALLAAGHEVRIFDRQAGAPQGFPRAREVEWAGGDFQKQEDLARAVAGCEVIYHLVSNAVPGPSSANAAAEEADVRGTRGLLEAWRRERAARIVFTSSGGTVYGVPRTVPIPEDHPTEPVSTYGMTKLAIEHDLERWRTQNGLAYCALRVANAYGERQRTGSGQGAVAAFLYRAHRGEPVEIWGDGSVVRDYVYAGDIARALVRAASYRGEHRVFNIGSGAGLDLNQLVAVIERVTGRAVARRYLPGRPFDVPSNVLDIRRARAALGWEPLTSFEEGLARTLRSYEESE